MSDNTRAVQSAADAIGAAGQQSPGIKIAEPELSLPSVHAKGQTVRHQKKVKRREALAMLAAAISMSPGMVGGGRTRIVTLSEESEAIIESLIAAGYHKTRQEVVNAAMAAIMARPW